MALLVDILVPGQRDQSLRELWVLIQDEYAAQETRNRLTILTHGMIKGVTKTFPCLSAKAVVVRDILPVMVDAPPRLSG